MLHYLNALRPVSAVGALALSIGMMAPAHAANFYFSVGAVGNTPNTGPWAYVERDPANNNMETVLTNLTAGAYGGSSCYQGGPCWTPMWNDPTQPNSVPAFSANNTNQDWLSYGTSGQAFTLPKRCLFMHPGRNLEAVLRFTVPPKPVGGSYSTATMKGSTITDQDFNGGNGVLWWVEVNGVPIPGAGGTLDSTPSNPLSSMLLPGQPFAVTTGTVINLVVDSLNGDENYDTTGVCGKITLN
jgi:hypothetical protein